MKKLLSFATIALAITVVASCGNPKTSKTTDATDDSAAVEATADSTLYGVCGEGTTMNYLELVTDGGDSLIFLIPDADSTAVVMGGLLAGDRLAVIPGADLDGEHTVAKAINLTTLQGKWVSIDKNFEILDGGQVKSNVKAESNPWTSWKILNGKLLLNRDTFDIDLLSADSLYLEDHNGIFTYKRIK